MDPSGRYHPSGSSSSAASEDEFTSPLAHTRSLAASSSASPTDALVEERTSSGGSAGLSSSGAGDGDSSIEQQDATSSTHFSTLCLDPGSCASLVDANDHLDLLLDDYDRHHIGALPEPLLQHVFSFLPTRERICSLPLVCRQFARVLGAAGPLWVKTALPPCDGSAYRLWAEGQRVTFRCSATRWFQARGCSIESLDLTAGGGGRKPRSAEFLLDLALAALPSTRRLRTFVINCQAPVQVIEPLSFCPDLRVLHLDLLTGLDARPAALSALGQLPALRVLKLNWSSVVPFPRALLGLEQLSVLTIGAVDSLPDGISRLTALTRLELLSLILRRTPPQLALLPNLSQLGLYASREGQPLELGDELSSLTRLHTFWVADGAMGNTRVLGRLPSLRSLWFHTCALGGLPQGLSALTGLERLILLNDCVRELPAWVSRLKSLASLSILENQAAVALCSEVTALTALTALRCSRAGPGAEGLPLLSFQCAGGGGAAAAPAAAGGGGGGGAVFPAAAGDGGAAAVVEADGGDGGGRQGGGRLAVDFGFDQGSGELLMALRCPPGTDACILQQGACLFPFIAAILSRPARRQRV